jgi:septal ring factor EnvC (AmiA/AmiB activator)
MNNATGVLPNLEALNPGELKELLVALHEQDFSHRKQIATQQQEILSQREQLASRDTEIETLKLLIAKLRRMQFGRSSEKLNRQIEQLELRLGDLKPSRGRWSWLSLLRHDRRGGHCLRIYDVKCKLTCRNRRLARTVVES